MFQSITLHHSTLVIATKRHLTVTFLEKIALVLSAELGSKLKPSLLFSEYLPSNAYRPQFAKVRSRAASTKAASVYNEYNGRWKPVPSSASQTLLPNSAPLRHKTRTLERLIDKPGLDIFQREAVREELIRTVRYVENTLNK